MFLNDKGRSSLLQFDQQKVTHSKEYHLSQEWVCVCVCVSTQKNSVLFGFLQQDTPPREEL